MKISHEPKHNNHSNNSLIGERRKSYLAQEVHDNSSFVSINIPIQDKSLLLNQKLRAETSRTPSSPDISNIVTQNDQKKILAIKSPIDTDKKEKCKGNFSNMMQTKYVDNIFLIPIILYILLIVVNIIIDDLACESPDLKIVSYDLKFFELALIGIFIIEIILKIYAFGFSGYYHDKWYIIDTIIILSTLALVLIDIFNANTIHWLVNLRGTFRIFRIILLMRKANEFTNVTKKRKKFADTKVQSPVEKILNMLQNFLENTNNETVKQEISWAIDIISNNKLYEPVVDESITAEKKAEAENWVNNYRSQQDINDYETKENRRKSLTVVVADTHPERKISLAAYVSNISHKILERIENEIDNISFNVFEIHKNVGGDELSLLLHILFKKNELYERLDIHISTFNKFTKKIQNKYFDNPYHNALHATDVTQTINYLLTKGKFIEDAELSPLEIASMYLAAAVHDLDHPGFNNSYQINTRSDYAIRYNDRSVLENYHISTAFGIIREEEYNIFKNFSKENYNKIRERMICMVLSTDMAHHFTELGKLKARLSADFSLKDKDKNFFMDFALHCSDISNSTKPWEISKEWSFKILEELWVQGDKEREIGLPISYLCDRYTTNTAKSQIGFIDFIAQPTWELMKQVLPAIDISNLEINKEKWKELIEFYDAELITKNEEFEKLKKPNTEQSTDETKILIKKP